MHSHIYICFHIALYKNKIFFCKYILFNEIYIFFQHKSHYKLYNNFYVEKNIDLHNFMFYVFVLTLFFYVTYELFLSDIKYIYIKQYNKRTYKRTKIEYQTKRKRRIYINSTHHYHGNEEIFDKNC